MTLAEVVAEGDVTFVWLGRSPHVHLVAECRFMVSAAQQPGVRPVDAGSTFCFRLRWSPGTSVPLTRADFNANPCPACARRFAQQRGDLAA